MAELTKRQGRVVVTLFSRSRLHTPSKQEAWAALLSADINEAGSAMDEAYADKLEKRLIEWLGKKLEDRLRRFVSDAVDLTAQTSDTNPNDLPARERLDAYRRRLGWSRARNEVYSVRIKVEKVSYGSEIITLLIENAPTLVKILAGSVPLVMSFFEAEVPLAFRDIFQQNGAAHDIAARVESFEGFNGGGPLSTTMQTSGRFAELVAVSRLTPLLLALAVLVLGVIAANDYRSTLAEDRKQLSALITKLLELAQAERARLGEQTDSLISAYAEERKKVLDYTSMLLDLQQARITTLENPKRAAPPKKATADTSTTKP